MKNLVFLLPVFFLFMLFNTSITAQKAPIKYGKVEMKDMKMKRCSFDTSAAAMILCDYGYFDEQEFKFKRTRRIKIFSKAGYHLADFKFYGGDDILLRGKTFNLEKGEIVETKLKKESIFKERIYEDHYSINISMPNVREGSVIDIYYEIWGLPIEGWDFQSTVPVKRSELIIPESSFVEFRKTMVGYLDLDVSSETRWVGLDIPAFKAEAYTNSIKNYISRMNLEVMRYMFPGFYREYASTWENIDKKLLESDYFFRPAKNVGFLKDHIKTIKAEQSDDLSKAQAAYDLIQEVNWSGRKTIFTTDMSLRRVYNEDKANCAEINLMLIGTLNDLGIEANPVILSTVDNGRLNPYFPTINGFDYLVAHVEIGEEVFFLDATGNNCPFGMLPPRCMNGLGRLIKEGDCRWLNIPVRSKEKTLHYYDLSLNEDFRLSGNYLAAYDGYSALTKRLEIASLPTEDESFKQMESNRKGFRISNTKIENLNADLDKAIKLSGEVEIKDQLKSLDDLLFFNMMLYHALSENPFKANEREYPVHFYCPIDETVLVNIKLPPNVVLSELPQAISLKLPEKAATFSYAVTKGQDMSVRLRYNFKINKLEYLPDQYANLKQFYDEVISKCEEMIVLNAQ